MRSLSDTITRLSALRSMAGTAAAAAVAAMPDRLRDMSDFGRNPGALRARTYVPTGLAPGAPLVVVLHGCTQSAADYDAGTGWSDLADAAGFALLFPEQQRANNANLCFNWFVPEDIRAGGGEAESIRQMTEAMVRREGLDRGRIFVTGLSAGAAMTMTMLATAPGLFAGGAAIAGLAHGIAASVPEAFDRMRGSGLPSPRAAAGLVRAASAHDGAWPTLSVWQGSADKTVDAANAEVIAAAWALLHGAGAPVSEQVAGHSRRVWRRGGRNVVEAWTIAGMGHGLPITTHGAEACGRGGPYSLEAGISSTRRIAASWGIAPMVAAGPRRAVPPPPPSPPGLDGIIGKALRQAGLLR